MKILSMFLLFALGCTGAARADTFTVTRFDDPAPDPCAPGDCSLREAALAADANDALGPIDVIVLAGGNYNLTQGELPLHQKLIVQGAGASVTHVTTDAILFDGHDLSLDLRRLSMQTSASPVVRIGNNGTLLLDDVATPAGGGSVVVYGTSSDLQIRNSDLRQLVGCAQTAGTCSIIDSQLTYLSTTSTSVPGPAVLLSGSLMDGALDPGGMFSGIVLNHAASIEIEDSTITHTTLGLHDVEDPLASVHLHRLIYTDNAAPIRFGGVLNYENSTDVLITDSVLDSNPIRAIFANGQSTWFISGTSFVGNSVNGNAGGAVVVEESVTMHIENSTFSGNTFAAEAAQAGARGAAIGYRNGSGLHVDVQHVTIVPPTITVFGIQGNGIAGYGGTGAVVVDISNSILAGSCSFDSGALHTAVGNIESPGHSCGLSAATNQIDVSSTNLARGSLGDHGGPTPTYEPSPASVAVDAASQGQCLALDQRRYLRPAGAGCDVGAVEVGAIERIFANGFQ
ncbi:MAG: choice-of-anchor Q domain-containing protein [Dokdonella sp.]